MKAPTLPLALAMVPLIASADEPRLLDPRTPRSPVVLWSTALGMTGEVTVAGDAILVGSTNRTPSLGRHPSDWTHVISTRDHNDKQSNTMICLEARTGSLRWRSIHPQVHDRSIGIPDFQITSKPCVDGDRVYYLSVNWELVCADLQGFRDGENDGPFDSETFEEETDADIVWRIDFRKDLGVKPRGAGDVGYVQSSPVVMGDLVYVVTGNGSDHALNGSGVPAPEAPSFLAVDKKTGKVVWSSTAPGKDIIWLQGGSPASAPKAGEIIFPGGDGCLYGFDAKSGKQHWKMDLNAAGGTKRLFFETQPLVVDGTVVTSLRACIECGPQKGAPLLAIAPGGNPGVKWMFGKDLGGFWWQLLEQEGTVYAVSAPNLLHAVDPESGAERWRLEVGRRSDAMGLKLGGGGGLLFLTNAEGGFFLVRSGDKPELIGTFEWNQGFSHYGRPTVSEHGICVPAHNGVLMLRIP